MKKQSICISGYYGPGNYGDELMRQTLAEHLSDYELVNFRKDIHTQDIRTGINDRFDESVAVIIGGGDLLVPSHGLPRYWDQRLLHKPVFVYGVGVPKQCAESSQAIDFYRNFLNHPNVKLIVARDHQSADWIRNRLALDKEVACFPDIVWARSDKRIPSQRKRIALITRSLGKTPIDYHNISEFCGNALNKGFSVQHIILGVGKIREDDLHESIRLPIQDADITIRSNISSLIREIAQCSAVASMKYHGCVTALMMKIPVISLLKHAKFQNLFENFGAGNLCCSYLDTDLPHKIEYLLDQNKASGDSEASAGHLTELQAEARKGISILGAAIRKQTQNGALTQTSQEL
jgi:polysaccharide pyruvyl transferase WcaK-like protein